MLNVFRKHQKGIFIVTTGVIILSFSVFGTMGSMGGDPQVKEELLVRAIDGSAISRQKVERMMHFLSSSQMDSKDDRIASVNLLNDGALEKQFLESSLGRLLVEKLSGDLQKDMEKILEQTLSFSSYRNERIPFISAESVWAQFSPELPKIVRELTSQSFHLSLARKFELLSQARLQSQMVPSSFIKKILAYQERQVSNAEVDPALAYADVSLLGLHSAKEWFGDAFLKAVSQVIINGSALAKKQGIKVSSQEVRSALLENLKQAIDLLSPDKKPEGNLYQMFLHQVRNLGLTERECIDLWKDVVLFRKLVQKAMDDISLDADALASLQGPAKDQIKVKQFSLPHHLQLRDLTSLWKLQVYLEAISPKKHFQEHPLFAPTEFLSLSEIEKKAPDLVHRNYVLQYAELDTKKAASSIGIKETWSWQLEESGWNWLRNTYSSLAKSTAANKEERFAALEQLDAKERAEIDRASREQILAQHPSKMKEFLEASEKKTLSIAVTKSGLDLPFQGLKNPSSFVLMLEASNLQEKIDMYTEDQQHYYSFSVLERAPAKNVKTYAEANASGALRRMLDKKLENAYPEVRKKDSLTYMKKDGSWKPFSEVSEKVAKAVFAPTIKAIVAEYKTIHGKEPSKEQLESSSFYTEYWMSAFLQKARLDQESGLASNAEDSLSSQWNLVPEEDILERGKYAALASLPFVEGSWSPVLSLVSGRPCFFQVLQTLPRASVTEAEMEILKAPMKKEAEKKLFDRLFSEIESKQAISL